MTIPMEKRSETKTYAELLRELKEFLRMTKPELARHLGTSLGTMDAWLYRGGIPHATMRRKIERIASEHGLTIPK